jgi:hypothetical protein
LLPVSGFLGAAMVVVLATTAAAAPSTTTPGGRESHSVVAPHVFSPPPLMHAHSHNDYANTGHELTAALDENFNSVEADVWLKDDNILVGHDDTDLQPDRSLQNLYLDPLLSQVQYYDGSVYDGWDVPFILVIELKGETGTNNVTTSCTGENAKLYQRVHDTLENEYASMLSSYDNGVVTEGAVKIVFTGHTPRDCMQANHVRHEFFDASAGDYTKYTPQENPIVTADWTTVSDITGFTNTAHEYGRQVRFYNTPQDVVTWQIELDAGVDFLNTDLKDYPDDLYNFLVDQDGHYGWAAATGAGSTVQLDNTGSPATVSGTLYVTGAANTCAYLSVTLYRLDGTADPVYRQSHCGANTGQTWVISGVESADQYTGADVSVSADNGPVTTRTFDF